MEETDVDAQTDKLYKQIGKLSIEDHQFSASPLQWLLEGDDGDRGQFATSVCRNYNDGYGTDYSTNDYNEGNLRAGF